MKNQKGITLITLVITIIIMLILIVTITVNINPFKSAIKRNSFEEDFRSLQEAIVNYYARNKELPVINKYTSTFMLDDVKNVNDGDDYYVIDIRQLDVDLHFGREFYNALARDIESDVDDLLDLYIINKQSHTIYYPKGITFDGMVIYTLYEEYSFVQSEVKDTVPPDVKIIMLKSDKLFAVRSIINISDAFSGVDFDGCKYIFNESSSLLGTNEDLYTGGTITEAKTIIEKVMAPSDGWYLHVLAKDKAGNVIEFVSGNSVEVDEVANFDYTGSEQVASLLPGSYKMECWGAQGQSKTETLIGGYGSYSTGSVLISNNQKIYVNVGGTGNYTLTGYNGGQRSMVETDSTDSSGGAGGGATHIATVSGELKNLESYKNTGGNNISNEIIIVSGGGGGYSHYQNSTKDDVSGSSAGGIIGNISNFGTGGNHTSYSTGGSQISGGTAIITNEAYGNNGQFGIGGIGTYNSSLSNGHKNSGGSGGGGWYGGAGASIGSGWLMYGATGGSGYIGNPLLKEKYMVGYNVEASNEESTKTISTTNVSQDAISDYAKKGNGYARITNLN